MKTSGHILIITLLFSFFSLILAQKITNVRQKIENGRIVITYDLSGYRSNIHITAEKDGMTIVPSVTAGDITSVTPGKGKFIWWEPVLEGRALNGWYVTLTAEMSSFEMVFIPGRYI